MSLRTDSRALVRKTLEFSGPDRIPRQAWILPWAEQRHPVWVSRLRESYPDDIVTAPAVYINPPAEKGGKYDPGEYVDPWGCIFKNRERGIMGVVKEPRIRKWEDLERYQTPEALLDLDAGSVNAFCRESRRFVLAGTLIRPFERLHFLRTMEQALIDLIEQPPELKVLLGRIHGHYLKEVEVWARTDVDAIYLMDDWGVQQGLMVSPDWFRAVFKPMYREYAEIAKKYGKYVFMHSDGCITEIIPDLIEVGVHAVNSQIALMGVQELGRRFAGRLTFWGEMDRQQLLPRGTGQEVDRAVKDVYRAFYRNGGVIAQCEFGPGVRPENVFRVFKTWNDILKSG